MRLWHLHLIALVVFFSSLLPYLLSSPLLSSPLLSSPLHSTPLLSSPLPSPPLPSPPLPSPPLPSPPLLSYPLLSGVIVLANTLFLIGISLDIYSETYPSILYSRKLAREKTFMNFAVLWLFVKVFSTKLGSMASFGTVKANNP